MSEHHEDPAAHAGARAVSYLTLAATALESVVAARAARADTAVRTAHAQAGQLRGAHRAAHTAARLHWQPALRGTRPGGTTAGEAGTAWAAAQGWREHDPEAEQAATLAEQRLRELDPTALARIDRLRATGLGDADALRLAAPALDDRLTPDRAAPPQTLLGTPREAARLRGAADAEQQQADALLAVGDDPATPRVDEHAEARGQQATGYEHTAGELLASAPARSAAELAAEGFPLPLPPRADARPAAAAAGAPVPVQVRARAAAAR